MNPTAWSPWLYQYGIGGLLAAFTIFLAIRSGALRLARREDRRILSALILGFAGFALVHGLWIAGVLR